MSTINSAQEEPTGSAMAFYPTEGYVLSNGIRAVISRPRFIDTAFAVGEEDARVTLRIKY